MKKRLLSIITALALCFSLLPAQAFAVENNGQCEHHTEHTADCGYAVSVEGHDCGHVHDESCGYREDSPCIHIHDENCGYVEAVDGQPCGFVCDQCAGASDAPGDTKLEEDTATVLTDWEWVDDWEIIDLETGLAHLPFANEDNVAYFEDIAEMLPVSILAVGEELTLGDWVCEDYPEEGAYEGEYVFWTTLPEGYAVPEGGSTLTLTVALGDPEGEPATALAVALTSRAVALTGSIKYLDGNSREKTYTGEYVVVTDSETVWGTSGQTTWYMVNGNVTINSRVTVKGHVNLILADDCILTLNGGIMVYDDTPANISLTIYGQSEPALNGEGTLDGESNRTGKLIADASYYGESYTGIGPAAGTIASQLTINGGVITAKGSSKNAEKGGSGIGCTTTINGGYVEATGGGKCGGGITVPYYLNIIINGGTVIATGGTGSAGIGGQYNSSGSTITINGGTVTASSTGDGAGIGSGNNINGAGNFTSESTITINGGTVTATSNGSGSGIGSGKGGCKGGRGCTIIITDGTVTATGGKDGAGIGGSGSKDNITIENGTVTATGGQYGAGIGGRAGVNGGTIKISGGKVTATSNSHGAGIGGGSGGSGDAITISGSADVIATGGTYGAGIGGGSGGIGGEITISGGTVKATGTSAAGIGGGSGGDGGTIKISGGSIEATGSDTYGGAGIGGGSQRSNGGEITISGGTVTATGGVNCAGIGGGNGTYGTGGSGGKITISGGTVTATGGSTYGGAGIGGGTAGSSGIITISGGTVTATGSGSTGSAGIGGGGGGYGDNGGNAETITISGGTIIANGSNGAAGIGGGKGYSGKTDGNSGTFTTTDSGTAIIRASSIGDTSSKESSWRGIIFEGSDGGVYGAQTLRGSFTVASTENLLVCQNGTLNAGSYLTNRGNIYVDGTLSGNVSGNVYYPLTLADCTATGATTSYNSTSYGKAGASIRLTASSKTGYIFDKWTTTPTVSISGNSFTMPNMALSVTANYIQLAKITTQPQNQTITYGDNVELSVSAQNPSGGTDGLTYQWYKGSEVLTGEKSNTLTLTKPNAGTYQYKCAVTYGGVAIDSDTAIVTVNRAAGGVTITGDLGKTYDGQPAVLTEDIYTTTGDGTVTVEYTERGKNNYSTTAPKNAGDYTVKVTQGGGTNYAEASETKDFTISRKPVTVSGIDAENKTYDGSTDATLYYANAVFAGKLENDTLTVTAAGAFADQNADEDKVVNITGLTLGGDSMDNYILAAEGQQVTTTASIRPKAVIVTIDSKTSVYGQAIVKLTATDNGIESGDTGVYTLSTTATPVSNAGRYDITGVGKSANYDFTFVKGTYTITPATQSATVTMEDWTYGDTAKEPVVTGNVENGAVTYRYKAQGADDSTYGAVKPTDAGSYTVEATIAATTNYQGTVVSGDFTIAPKTLTVTGLTAADRGYDGTNKVTLTGGALAGIVSGDEGQVTAAMPATGTIASADAGDGKTVTFSEITLTGDKAGNYILTQPKVTVNISKAEPDVGTVTKTSPDTIYSSTAPNSIALNYDGTTNGTLKLTDGQTLTVGTANYGWTFIPDSTNYKTVTGQIELEVVADTLVSITIGNTAPATTSYKYGESFKTDGLTVTATYASGATRDVTAEVTFGDLAVGDTSIELSYQGKTCTVSGLTVRKAEAPTLADISVQQKYTVNTRQSKDIGRAGMPADAGDLTYTQGIPHMSDPITIYGWNVDNTGKVTYTLSSTQPNCRATLPVVITSTNYEDATVNIHITLTEKDVPTVNANEITVTYTGSAVPDSAITGTASVDGTWRFKDAAPVKVADSSNSVTVVFIPADTVNYETVEDTIKVTINKATPTGTPIYTAITTGGKTLADAKLAIGTITPAGGSIAWDVATGTAVTANTAYNWTYTPADMDNYNNLTGSFTPYVVSDSGSGFLPPVQKPEIVIIGSGKAPLSADGTVATITADKGYELVSVVLNGKNMGKVDKLTGLKTGDKAVITFQKKADKSDAEISKLIAKVGKLKLVARSKKTAKKNVKVVLKTNVQTKAAIRAIKDAGYTVKYKFYRSVKKSAGYKAMKTKSAKTYYNTYGKKGTMYYYKAKVMVYDKEGNLTAKTKLKQCKYAKRLWTKQAVRTVK